MSDETLRECPHCGYAPYFKSFEYRGFGGMGYWVTCTHCGNRTWETDTPEKAIAAWNTRVPDPAAEARIAELEAEGAALKERRCENCCWGQVITTHKPWENSSETYALCFHQDAQIPRVNLALDHRCDHWYSREDTDAE